MRFYTYQLDGSREMVYRVGNRFGLCWDWYRYDVVSGRLASVQDMWAGEANSFVWNPEGTLARWSEAGTSYERVYSYDEEGRLVRIERDYGGGRQQARYVYRYNVDGMLVEEQEWLETPRRTWLSHAYRYLCGIGCRGLPLVIYWDDGSDSEALWVRYEWYTKLWWGYWYEGYEADWSWRNMGYALLAGDLLVAEDWRGMPWYVLRYRDRYGVLVGERIYPSKVKRYPHWGRESGEWPERYVPMKPSELPKPEAPWLVPELPENPILFLPNPTGPINTGIKFCNGIRRGAHSMDAGIICAHFLSTPEGFEWC